MSKCQNLLINIFWILGFELDLTFELWILDFSYGIISSSGRGVFSIAEAAGAEEY
jgi:hypothetical protein